MVSRTTLSALAVCATLATLGACDEVDFEEFQEVAKLRVLAIRVTPPELGPGDVAQIDALVVDPAGGEVRYAWELCALDQGPDGAYACARAQSGERLGFTLSESADAEIPYDALTEVFGSVSALCERLSEIEVPAFVEIPVCERGFPMTLRLVASVGDGEGNNEEIATKRVLLLREEVASSANTNPAIDGLLVGGSPVAAGGVVSVPFGSEPIPLQVIVDVAQAEEYESDEGVETEVLALSWFTTAGQLERSTTYYSKGSLPAAELQTNELKLGAGSAAAPGEQVHLWVVLRDDRGGTDFVDFFVDVVEP